MKTLALLLMLLGVLLILGVGVMSVLVFAMAFDAPGSADSPGVWATSILIFLPLLLLLVALIFAFISYVSGNYRRAVLVGSVFGVALVGGFAFFTLTSLSTLRYLHTSQAEAAENARLYPEQRFIRPFEGGADTIIVFPDRIVAYRMPKRGDMPYAYSGPVGDLNVTRDAIVIDRIFDRKIGLDEFSEFMDEQGRKLTEMYSIR